MRPLSTTFQAPAREGGRQARQAGVAVKELNSGRGVAAEASFRSLPKVHEDQDHISAQTRDEEDREEGNSCDLPRATQQRRSEVCRGNG